MKRWQKWLLVVAVVAAGWLWYTRPMTLEQLVPGFDWEAVTQVGGMEHTGSMSLDPVVPAATLSAEDDKVQDFLLLCGEARFRRDPLTALSVRLQGYQVVSGQTEGSFPQLCFMVPEGQLWLELLEDGGAEVFFVAGDSSRELFLRSGDEGFFQTALEFLRANPVQLTPLQGADE